MDTDEGIKENPITTTTEATTTDETNVDGVTNDLSQISLNGNNTNTDTNTTSTSTSMSETQTTVDVVAAPSNNGTQTEFPSTGIEASSYWIPPSIRSLRAIVRQLLTDESVPNHQQMWLSGSTTIRKLLSLEMQPPITPVLDEQNGIIVGRLLYFLTFDSNPHLQFESLWALTNIASGTSEELDRLFQMETFTMDLFLKLILSPSREVSEQAVWLIGNIAGDGPQNRDMIIDNGAISILLEALKLHSSPTNKRNVTWALSNCCRGKPQPSLEKLELALPTLCSFLTETDVELVTDACWSLAYISDGDNDRIQAIIDTNSLPTVNKLLRSEVLSILTPSVRIIGNICTGDENQTDSIIDCGVLPQLKYLMDHNKTNIRKEACWAISNITAGNQKQVQAVIEAEIIPPLLRVLANDRNIVQNEAAWAISNLAGVGTYDQIRYLVEKNCIPILVDWLRNQDAFSVINIVEAFDNILKHDKSGKWSSLFDQRAKSYFKSLLDEEEEDEDEDDEDDDEYDEDEEDNINDQEPERNAANPIPALPSGAPTALDANQNTNQSQFNNNNNAVSGVSGGSGGSGNGASRTKNKPKKAINEDPALQGLIRSVLSRFQNPQPSSLMDLCIDHICDNEQYFTSKPTYVYIPDEIKEKINTKLSIDKLIKSHKSVDL